MTAPRGRAGATAARRRRAGDRRAAPAAAPAPRSRPRRRRARASPTTATMPRRPGPRACWWSRTSRSSPTSSTTWRTSCGYRCLVAARRRRGAASSPRSYLPDAILLDMRLPDGSGLSVLQRLKDDPRTRHIPVHVVSAEDSVRERRCTWAPSATRVKPDHARRAQGGVPAPGGQAHAEGQARAAGRGRRAQRDSVVQLIGDDDIEIAAVEPGAGGAGAAAQPTVFDCMIIDLKLPDMQGSELLKRMASEEICSFPPVIVYTGRNLTRDEEAELLNATRARSSSRAPARRSACSTRSRCSCTRSNRSCRPSARRMLRTARSRDKRVRGPPHPAGRRRRAQHLRADQRAGAEGRCGGDRPQRPRGAGQARRGARHRPGADGRDDAGHGRPRGHAPHPRRTRAGASCRSSRSPPRR